jgi:hypothetical protein
MPRKVLGGVYGVEVLRLHSLLAREQNSFAQDGELRVGI